MNEKIHRIEHLRTFGLFEIFIGAGSALVGTIGAAGSIAVEAARHAAGNTAQLPLQQMELERIGVISAGTLAISGLLIVAGFAGINAGVEAYEEARQIEATIPVTE